MNLADNDFELFDLPARFTLDNAALDQRWRELQAQVHPDRHAAQGPAAQRVAMQWAVRVNEAYQRLTDPLRRAAYLCELNGASIQAETNTSMPSGFLMQQMSWRESLDEASTLSDVQRLADEVSKLRAAALVELSQALDHDADFAVAATHVRALMFVERFAQDVERRLEVLEQ